MNHASSPISRLALLALLAGPLLLASGCSVVLPEVTHRPVIRNPFPQLSRVAVAPFFNHTDEPTVDGRQFAMAYFAELQATPGFEVVPVGVVEEAILRHRIDLSGPGEARRLARLLDVDAIAIGAVTDFTAYYPPRCGLSVEWYSANATYHEIPAGYGLPWNTPEEEFIPDSLVYESRLAQARSQMAPSTSVMTSTSTTLPPPPHAGMAPHGQVEQMQHLSASDRPDASAADATAAGIDPFDEPRHAPVAPESEVLPMPAESGLPAPPAARTTTTAPTGAGGAMPLIAPALPMMAPAPAAIATTPAAVNHGPVLSHTQLYRGNDPEITESLKGYVYFQDDARFGGWEGYLQRSDDFIRFCCHMHINEMLSARGGSRKTSVVWRWPEGR